MTAIDLSTIIFRAFQRGDLDPPPQNIPDVAQTNTVAINLDGIKFRVKQIGEVEE